MSLVVLFDDERSFLPGFRDEATVVRTVDEAKELFASLSGETIDELWLDFVLSPGSTTDALPALAGVKATKILFHSSAYAAKELVEHYLKQAGIETPVEIHGREVFVPETR